jgi:protein-S-isoprenylcysteine O-methyltransferase Ste14
MKWIGIGLMSVIMGVFLAVVAQTVYPALTEFGFIAAAIGASAAILAILVHLLATAGTIAVYPPAEWDISAKLK